MTLAKTILLIILDVILNEKGYVRSTSQQKMYGSMLFYKTIEESDKPISTCLLDHMKNDVNFSDKYSRISNKQRNLTDITKVFETLVSNEALLNQDSTVQDVTTFSKSKLQNVKNSMFFGPSGTSDKGIKYEYVD